MTPNPEVMKFVSDRPLIAGSDQAEFNSKASTVGYSSLAEELFNFPFVTGIFISGGFVSVTKDDTIGWEMIAMQMREYIQGWLSENETAGEKIPPMVAPAATSEADQVNLCGRVCPIIVACVFLHGTELYCFPCCT